jgi:hypothetical protein
MAGRTTLMISHNLLTVTDADRILFLEDGRVSATGTHRELLVHSPGYARLYRLHHPDDAESARATTAGPQTGRHRAGAPRHAVDRPHPARTPEAGPAPLPRLPEPGHRAAARPPGRPARHAAPVLASDVPADGGAMGWFGLPPDAPVPRDGALSALPLAEPVPARLGGGPHVQPGRHAATPAPRPRRGAEPDPSDEPPADSSAAASVSVPPAAC